MFLLLANFGTLTFSAIGQKLIANPGWQGGVLTVIALCLLLGATGKSAQLPLYIWLPDAMEGPTPVSALIHAATMVTAGVYMIARTHVLFDHSPFALSVVATVGARRRAELAGRQLVETLTRFGFMEEPARSGPLRFWMVALIFSGLSGLAAKPSMPASRQSRRFSGVE